MILYGHKTKALGSVATHIPCPHCHEQKLTLVTLQKYAHVWYIPFFPMGKKCVGVCENCQKITEAKSLEALPAGDLTKMEKQFKTPLWAYSFCFVMAVLAGGIAINEHRVGKEKAALLASPRIGDVYVIELPKAQIKDNFRYSYVKIINVTADHMVAMKLGKMAYESSAAIKPEETANDSNYDTGYFEYTHDKLPKVIRVYRSEAQTI